MTPSPLLTPLLTPLHMGALHPFEQVLTVILAFGPFLVLGAVIVRRRRQDDRDVDEETQETAPH